MLCQEHLALTVDVDDVHARYAVGQEHEVLVRRGAEPDLKADPRQVAGLQIEALRDGEVDPSRRIAAQGGIDRAARLRARLPEQRRGKSSTLGPTSTTSPVSLPSHGSA